MSRERHDTLVEELEHELRQALAIEPSPGFTAQVRARIEQHTPATVWPYALATAAVCILALALGWRFLTQTGDVVPPPPLTRIAADVQLRPESTPEPSTSTPRTTRNRPSVNVVKRVTRERVSSEPEVIVPPDRARALARLLALARSGAVDEERLRPIEPPTAPATLDVAPLAVPPIAVPEIEVEPRTARGGAGQE